MFVVKLLEWHQALENTVRIERNTPTSMKISLYVCVVYKASGLALRDLIEEIAFFSMDSRRETDYSNLAVSQPSQQRVAVSTT